MGEAVRHEARLYRKGPDNDVFCQLCSHQCHILPGKTGICKVRLNRDGVLDATTYALASAEAIDPVEKKPLYHYLPGTDTYSLGSIGCNFSCSHCQNWHISRSREGYPVRDIPVETGVKRALGSGCRSLSWTYNEPTIWHEYTLEMAQEARKEHLGTVYVTNGYMTEDALAEIGPFLTAFRVDIKAFRDEFYRTVCHARLGPVLDATLCARGMGIHIEIVYLVIPGLNDDWDELRDFSRWVTTSLGPATPVHFTRFHPDYRMLDRAPTPVPVLEKIYGIAREEGLLYPYLGNVPGHRFQNTYCPACGSLLIERSGFACQVTGLKSHQCRNCGELIPLVTTP